MVGALGCIWVLMIAPPILRIWLFSDYLGLAGNLRISGDSQRRRAWARLVSSFGDTASIYNHVEPHCTRPVCLLEVCGPKPVNNSGCVLRVNHKHAMPSCSTGQKIPQPNGLHHSGQNLLGLLPRLVVAPNVVAAVPGPMHFFLSTPILRGFQSHAQVPPISLHFMESCDLAIFKLVCVCGKITFFSLDAYESLMVLGRLVSSFGAMRAHKNPRGSCIALKVHLLVFIGCF